MKKYLMIASLLFLSACSASNNQGDSLSAATSVSTVFTSQFSDVPIPMEMKSKANETFTTISSSGEKVGKEAFSGRIKHHPLGAAMAQNLRSQGWSMLGIIQGNRTVQLYHKGSRYLIINIDDGTLGTSMELWMISKFTQNYGAAEPVQEVFSPPETPKNNQQRTASKNSQPNATPTNNQQSATLTNNQQGTAQKNVNPTPASSQNFDDFGSESLFK